MSNDIMDGGGYIEPAGDSRHINLDADTQDFCGLSIAIRVFGCMMIFLGILCGLSHSNDAVFTVLFIVGGVLFGMFNFALAVIVDACDKYRKSYKNYDSYKTCMAK